MICPRNLQELGYTGLYVGLGVALIPAAVTTLVACSKIILIHLITNIALGLLTLGAFTLEIHGLSFVEVPFLWTVSYWSAIFGGGIIAFSAFILAIDAIYQRIAPLAPQDNLGPEDVDVLPPLIYADDHPSVEEA